MANNTLKPDTILKDYWSDNTHFADFFNAVLFDGRPIIKPEDLQEMDTEASTIIEHRDYAESIQSTRDKIKIFRTAVAHGVRLALLGLENQERIHYAMPMRAMGYDYSAYKKQYDSNAKKYKDAVGLDMDEFLCKMKKTDRFIPVITIVIYYGEKKWDGAKSLHEMLNIPEEMKPYVNDYKMHLVEARENNLTFHNANNADLFHLLQIILDQSLSKNEAKQKAIEYSETHHTENSVIMTVASATNSKIDYNKLEGDGTMCTLFEEIAKDSKAEEIVESGREYSHTDDMILERLQRKLNLSLEEAEKCLELYGKI